MKVELTEETKEEFMIKAFNAIDKYTKRIRALRKKLENLRHNRDELICELESIEEEYKRVIDGLTGKGVYSEIAMKPVEIGNRLMELENSVYNPYSGLEDKESKKKYNLLKRPLEEDYEEAMEAVRKHSQYEKSVDKRLKDVRNRVKESKKEVKKCEREIESNELKVNKIKIQIQKVESSYEKGKSIDTKILVINKEEN